MDNKKKEKLVAIILTTFISLVTSVTACIFGISPDAVGTANTIQPPSDCHIVQSI